MEDAIRMFGILLRISRFASMEQQNPKPRLICNSSEALDAITPEVNASSDKSSAPNGMQFGPCLS